jgi:hypothetical protein
MHSGGHRAGHLEAQDVKMASYVVLGALNWIPNWYNPRGSLSKEQIGRMFAEQLVRGLRKVPSEP